MKQIFNFLVFILLFSNVLNSQTLKGVVIDHDTKKPMDLASLFFKESKYTIFTNPEGRFLIEIDSNNKKDELLISSIGYEDLIVSFKEFMTKKEYEKVFEMIPKAQQLEEILISNEKIDYSWAKTISSKRKPTIGFSFQFGTENVRLVQNPYFKNGKIKKVILSLKKVTKNRKQPEWEIDYVTAYSVKFYEYDMKNKKPGKELYDKNIIVEPANKSQNFEINVDSLHIPFSKNGVCVGIEYVNTRYVNPKKVFATIAPAMDFYEEKNFKPILSWIRYRGDSRGFMTNTYKEGKERYHDVLIMDLVVNTEK